MSEKLRSFILDSIFITGKIAGLAITISMIIGPWFYLPVQGQVREERQAENTAEIRQLRREIDRYDELKLSERMAVIEAWRTDLDMQLQSNLFWSRTETSVLGTGFLTFILGVIRGKVKLQILGKDMK